MGGRRIIPTSHQMSSNHSLPGSDNGMGMVKTSIIEDNESNHLTLNQVEDDYEDDNISVVSEISKQHHDTQKNETIINTIVPASASAPAPLLIPSLRGTLTQVGNSVVCKGVWAMSDASHSNPEQTSPFEFKLVKAFDGQVQYPVSGKYQGWFFLKQQAPAKGLKIDDKDMSIRFTKTEKGSYTIEGNGTNRFGTFTLKGTLSPEGYIQLYREYSIKPLPLKKKESTKLSVPSSDLASGTPREASGRVRKVSTFMKEYEETLTPKPKATVNSTVTSSALNSTIASTAAAVVAPAGRSQRLPVHIIKCGELLKEMQKYPQATWFLEPVDHIKLGIPDYVTIITKPMDFGTIAKNLEKGVYETPEQFAEHMRLVFRNAITYNQMRDHPVHVAARELNAKFEEKFRILLSNINNSIAVANAAAYAVEPKLARQTSVASSTSRKMKSPRPSGVGWNKGRPSSVGGGQRFDAFLLPAMDVGQASIIAMQRKMQEMQEELTALRTAVRQSEVKNTLEIQRNAAREPLSFDEKRNLIAQIHKLPADKMENVIEIIQSALKPGQRADSSEEIEIPLDELDTLTLRKLQRYVEDCNIKKKRPAGSSGPVPRNSTNSISSTSGNVSKRSRSDVYVSSSYHHHSVEVNHNVSSSSNHDFHIEDDELLFDPTLLEEEHDHSHDSGKQHPQSQQNQNEVGIKMVDNDQDFDEEIFGENESSIESNGQTSQVQVVNVAAWTHIDNSNNDLHPSQSTSESATVGDQVADADSSTWGAVAAEVVAKKQREAQRKEELERLRAQQEAQRLAQLQSAQPSLLGNSSFPSDSSDVLLRKKDDEEMRLRLLQKRQEEQRRRELEQAQAASALVDEKTDMMDFLDGDEVEEDDK